MKKLNLVVLLSLITLSFTNLKAQNADEIINNYFKTIDPNGKMATLTGIKMNGTVDQGIVIPVEVVDMKDGRTYTKISVQGQTFYEEVFDGTILWGSNFETGAAEKMDSEETENHKRTSSDFPTALLNYQSKGYKVEYLGKETKDGADYYKIKLTRNPIIVDGEEVEDYIVYYFNVNNNYLDFTEFPLSESEEEGQIMLAAFKNYKEVEGIYFPFILDYGGQALVINKMELNPTVKDSDFAFIGE